MKFVAHMLIAYALGNIITLICNYFVPDSDSKQWRLLWAALFLFVISLIGGSKGIFSGVTL